MRIAFLMLVNQSPIRISTFCSGIIVLISRCGGFGARIDRALCATIAAQHRAHRARGQWAPRRGPTPASLLPPQPRGRIDRLRPERTSCLLAKLFATGLVQFEHVAAWP